MPETAFLSAAEQTLSGSYKENPGLYAEFLERIDQKLGLPHDAETLAKLEAMKARLLDKRTADTAPTIGGSWMSMG